LADLIGGIQYVTLSDDEAKRRGTQKSILERKGYPAFEIIVEINTSKSWTIHEDVKTSVDLLLRNNFGINQLRQFLLADIIQIKCQSVQNSSNFLLQNQNNFNEIFNQIETSCAYVNEFQKDEIFQMNSKTLIIYSYSISNNFLKEVLSKINIKFIITTNITKASLIIGLKRQLRQNFKLKELANKKKIPIYSINQVTIYELTRLFKNIL
jgi:hypothetical protein